MAVNGQCGIGARVGCRPGAATGLGAPSGGFPRSLVELNKIFASYGASFSSAWSFHQLSGTSKDLGGVADLTPTSSPLQGLVGRICGDTRVVRITQGSEQCMSSATDVLNPGAGDLLILVTARFVSATSGNVVKKFFNNASSGLYRLLLQSDGSVSFQLYDGTTSVTSDVTATGHKDDQFHDFLFVADRTAASKKQGLVTDLGVSSLGNPPTGALSTSPEGFLVGDASAAVGTDFAFVAYGTTAGTLVNNLAEGLARWRRYRGA